jgi:hypothetical protein
MASFTQVPHQNHVHNSILPIRATCPAHLIRLDSTTCKILGKEYSSFSSSLCSFLHSPVTSSLLGPNTLLNTLSQTPSACVPPCVSNQVSHPYKTTGKIIVLYIFIFKFLDSNLEDNRFMFCVITSENVYYGKITRPSRSRNWSCSLLNISVVGSKVSSYLKTANMTAVMFWNTWH